MHADTPRVVEVRYEDLVKIDVALQEVRAQINKGTAPHRVETNLNRIEDLVLKARGLQHFHTEVMD
ncbi:MAG: hypothetical protein GF334_04955 [Candidatus Altiarchaeales archaeon]|nr:hypothetical protein [Candidatus Altiarchaeales archaeon]